MKVSEVECVSGVMSRDEGIGGETCARGDESIGIEVKVSLCSCLLNTYQP